jgi:hypothetical protein
MIPPSRSRSSAGYCTPPTPGADGSLRIALRPSEGSKGFFNYRNYRLTMKLEPSVTNCVRQKRGRLT